MRPWSALPASRQRPSFCSVMRYRPSDAALAAAPRLQRRRRRGTYVCLGSSGAAPLCEGRGSAGGVFSFSTLFTAARSKRTAPPSCTLSTERKMTTRSKMTPTRERGEVKGSGAEGWGGSAVHDSVDSVTRASVRTGHRSIRLRTPQDGPRPPRIGSDSIESTTEALRPICDQGQLLGSHRDRGGPGRRGSPEAQKGPPAPLEAQTHVKQ